MPFNQTDNFFLAFRLAVAKVYPNGNRKAQLSRHDFRIASEKFFPADKKIHKSCKIPHNVRVVLLGLEFLERVFGSGKGSGAALLFFVIAFAGVAVCIIFRTSRSIRALEKEELERR